MRVIGLYLWRSIMIELSWSFDCHLILYINFFFLWTYLQYFFDTKFNLYK